MEKRGKFTVKMFQARVIGYNIRVMAAAVVAATL
jgi:hypothetical protein